MLQFEHFEVVCFVNGQHICDIALTTSQGAAAAKRRAKTALIVWGYADFDDEFKFNIVQRIPADGVLTNN